MQSIATFFTPTKIIFGINSHSKISEEIKGLGADTVFLMTDRGVAQTDFFNKVMGVLKAAEIGVDAFEDVEPEPSGETVDKALALYRKKNAPVILAVGGGSSMDAAKGVGILATNGGSVFDYEGMNKYKNPPVPLIAVPTTAGTGSEVSQGCVFTDTKQAIKRTINHPRFNPARVAVLDPLSLITLPASVAAHAGMDAFVHAFESYISLQASPLSEAISLYGVDLIANNMRAFFCNRGNLEAGGKMLAGSTLATIGITNARTGNVHCMARFVGAIFHVSHGLSNAVLLPYVAEFNMIACPEKFARVAQIMGVDMAGKSQMEAARAAVSAIKDLCNDLGIPQDLREIGVKEEAIPRLAKLSFQAGYNAFNPRYTTEEDFEKLFRKAMG